MLAKSYFKWSVQGNIFVSKFGKKMKRPSFSVALAKGFETACHSNQLW